MARRFIILLLICVFIGAAIIIAATHAAGANFETSRILMVLSFRGLR
jgi:hypothetical protein